MDENLIMAYLEGRTTPEEEKEILKNISASDEDRRHLADMKAVHHWLSIDDTGLSGEKSFVKARDSLNRAISRKESQKHLRKYVKIFWTFSVAACLLVIIAVFSLNRKHILNRNIVSFCNPDSVVMRLDLPDGSTVCLREGTTLSYNNKYNIKKREVWLNGEAFFDITKNPRKPFIVKTEKAMVIVHGTVFNVKATCHEQEIETILASGSVSLRNTRGKNIVELKPGQQAIFNPHKDYLEVKQIPAWNILLDRYHVVMISEAPICEVIDIIQKTYHTRLKTNDYVPENQLITFRFQKSAALGDVVEMLELVSGHEFTFSSN